MKYTILQIITWLKSNWMGLVAIIIAGFSAHSAFKSKRASIRSAKAAEKSANISEEALAFEKSKFMREQEEKRQERINRIVKSAIDDPATLETLLKNEPDLTELEKQEIRLRYNRWLSTQHV